MRCFTRSAVAYAFLAIAFCFDSPALAQSITNDGTLNTTVSQFGQNYVITNGTAAGTNLFHSFQQFSVPAGGSATFNLGGANVSTIFSRVTGGAVSNINGVIQAVNSSNPGVNLFLMNPSGIVFGPGAQLNIGGSFVGTTANSIKFADGAEFASTATPLPAPLLVINVPVGLQMGTNSGAIAINGTGNDGIVPTSNLGMIGSPGRSLTLLGNGVTFDGGVITSPAGRIEVGSVGSGEVSLVPNAIGWNLGYGTIQEFRDITFSNRSSLWNPYPVSNPFGGVEVVGRDIRLDQSQIAAAAIGSGQSGDITIRAQRSLDMGGYNPNANAPSSWIVNQVSPGSTANGGGITIQSPNVTLVDGATIQTLSLGSGAAGNVQVNAEAIVLRGDVFQPSPFGPVANSGISSSTFAQGSGGNITLNARQLVMEGGGRVATVVGPGATGQGGDIAVVVSDRILARGVGLVGLGSSGIQALVLGSGKGGDVFVSAGNLTLQEAGTVNTFVYPIPGVPGSGTGNAGNVVVKVADTIEMSMPNLLIPAVNSFLGSATTGRGNAGNVTVSTSNLMIRDGASLTTGTAAVFGPYGDPAQSTNLGNGGNLSLSVRNLLDISGTSPLSQLSSTIGTYTFGNGNAGDALIQGDRAIIRDGAAVLSSTYASGNAGRLNIQAKDILVSGESSAIGASAPVVNSTTRAVFGLPDVPTGNTGELSIRSDIVTIQNGGQINVRHDGTGNAGLLEINANSVNLITNGRISASTASGQGGNLRLNVQDLLVMKRGSEISAESGGIGNGGNININAKFIVATGNSDIVANAFKGNGGNIQISTQGIFGLKFRPQRTPKNDITASSQFGVNGTVQITTLNIDPSSGLTELAVDLADPSQQIVTGCAGNEGNSFVATGRGGIPTNPMHEVRSDRTWQDTRDLSALRGSTSISSSPHLLIPSSPLLEANAIRRNPDGTIELVATQSAQTPYWQTCAQMTQERGK
jgi:filamentous hemagglutinin family protein